MEIHVLQKNSDIIILISFLKNESSYKKKRLLKKEEMKKANYQRPTIRIVKCQLQTMMLNESQYGIEGTREDYVTEEEEVWE